MLVKKIGGVLVISQATAYPNVLELRKYCFGSSVQKRHGGIPRDYPGNFQTHGDITHGEIQIVHKYNLLPLRLN